MPQTRIPPTWILAAFSTLLTLSPPALAQSATFEVASVRQTSTPVEGYRGGCHGINSVIPPPQQAAAPPLGQCVIRGARLSHLISTAYGIALINLKTGPDWIQRGDVYFDVQAKADDPNATEQQLLTMLQNLLFERFQLKFHRENSESAGFALAVAKNGPKLRASQGAQPGILFVGPGGESLPRPVPGQAVSLRASKVTMPMLINVLTLLGNGPMADRTGLSGDYDFTLSWDDNAGPALSTALSEQLGLKIDSAKIPVTTFVVDSAQKPSPN